MAECGRAHSANGFLTLPHDLLLCHCVLLQVKTVSVLRKSSRTVLHFAVVFSSSLVRLVWLMSTARFGAIRDEGLGSRRLRCDAWGSCSSLRGSVVQFEG